MPKNLGAASAKSEKNEPPRLSRARVIGEALALLSEAGPEALSMRALAQRLRVSPMALYNHFRDKRDLENGIAEALARQLEPPPIELPDWRERLRWIFHSLRNVCLENPAGMPMIESAESLGPAFFRPMEAALAALHSAGFQSEDALRAYYALANFTLGQVSYQIRGPFRGMDPAEALRRRTIRAEDFPLIARAATENWDFDAAFEFGLEAFLEGLASRGKAGTPRIREV